MGAGMQQLKHGTGAAFLITLLASSSVLAEISPRLSVVVKAGQEPRFGNWACQKVHSTLNEGMKPADALCILEGETAKELEAKRSGRYTHLLSITQARDGDLTLHIENWKIADETDFKNVEWVIRSDSSLSRPKQALDLTQDEALERLLRRFAGFHDHQNEFKKWALAKGSSTSAQVEYRAREGKFYDRSTGAELSIEAAYDRYKNESVKQRSFLRALREIAVVHGVEGATYYSSPAAQDFDYDWDKAGPAIFKRAKWRMDDNSWFFNHIGHPLTGMWTFQSGRGNGFGPLESALLSAAVSSVWEIVIEFRERISYNDLIMTPLSGSIMGEVLFQFEGAFTRGKDNWTNRILGAIFNAPETIRRVVFREKPRRSESLDEYGFANDFARKLDWATTLENNGTGRLGLRGEILKFKEFGEAGEESGIVRDTPLAEFLLQAGLDGAKRADLEWYFKTALIAYRKKRVEGDSEASRRGYELLIAPSHAFRMEILHPRKDQPRDSIATASIVGGTLDLTVYLGKTQVRSTVDVFGDFAAIRSIALTEYRKSHDITGMPVLLTDQGYHFAWGGTGISKFTLTRGKYELGGSAVAIGARSINGVSRHQDVVTKDYRFIDSRLISDVWVGIRTRPGLQLQLGVNHRAWNSRIQDVDFSVKGSRQRIFGKVIKTF